MSAAKTPSRTEPGSSARCRAARPISWLAAALLFCAPLAAAEQAQTVRELYERVRQQASDEAGHNTEREQRFRESADRQAALLADVQQRIADAERRRDRLKREFDANEDRLAELTTVLTRRIGDLGELFGVFRQTADDVHTLLFDSLITLEHPARLAEAEALAASTEVPTIPQLQTLWRLLLHEIALSGETSAFDASIIAPGGERYEANVTRVGLFNVVAGDKYLNYLPENNTVIELPRQPAGYLRDTAATLSEAAPGAAVTFGIDPSRGALLGLLVQSPSLIERIQQGKEVGYAIIGLAIVGLLLALERLVHLSIVARRMRRQLADPDHVRDDNPLGHVMQAYHENEQLDDQEVVARKLEHVVIRDVAAVKRGLPTIKVLAAVAPLMGLLGTVTGMIGTFQAITLFGTGDPKLMAGGISQALVTTVLGLCAAIPLLLLHSLLNSRATNLSKLIGEQAAGMMAQKAEAMARARSA